MAIRRTPDYGKGQVQAETKRREHEKEERRKKPYLFVNENSDLLYIENVATLLGCNKQTVHRIPRHELPYSKIGARNQYLRTDVLKYVKSKTSAGVAPSPTSPPLTSFRSSSSMDFNPVETAQSKLNKKTK